ncbi:MAG: hypothetical protein L0H59_01250 [Tomitella sp.]|nr:hypothetical protein [Tomitella sp.]
MLDADDTARKDTLLTTVPPRWQAAADSLAAAADTLCAAPVDTRLVGVDGTPSLSSQFVPAPWPARLLVDATAIAPTNRFGTFIDRLNAPAPSGQIVSALALLDHAAWWRSTRLDAATDGLDAALTFARVSGERLMLTGHPAESTVLEAAAPHLAGVATTLRAPQLARHLLSQVLPRVDAAIWPARYGQPAHRWVSSIISDDDYRQCIRRWRAFARLGQASPTGWLAAGAEWDAHLDDICGHITDEPVPRGEIMAISQAITDMAERAERMAAATVAAVDDAPDDEPLPVAAAGSRMAGAGIGLPSSRHLTYSPPSDRERAARDEFADRVSVASYRAPGFAWVPSPYPSGRLNMRELVRHSAQTAMNLPSTANPWWQLQSRPRQRAELTFGMVFDASLTMAPWAAHAAPLGWMVASAVHQVGGSCTVYGFGGDTFEVVKPGTAPVRVPRVVDSGSGSDGCPEALDAMIAGSRILSAPGVRVVVVLTDGLLPASDAPGIDRAVGMLADAGVLVLWVLPGPRAHADVVPARASTITNVTPQSFLTVVADHAITHLTG